MSERRIQIPDAINHSAEIRGRYEEPEEEYDYPYCDAHEMTFQIKLRTDSEKHYKVKGTIEDWSCPTLDEVKPS